MKREIKYCQLNQYHRKKIEEFLLYNYSLSYIAKQLGFNRSTISREIKRNSHNGKYYPVKAHKETKKRQSKAYKAKKLTKDMKLIIRELIEEDWSPEQISEWCKIQGLEMVAYVTIKKDKYH